MTKERRLGRGLEALLGRPQAPAIARSRNRTCADESSTEPAHGVVGLACGTHVYDDREQSVPAAPRFRRRRDRRTGQSLKTHGLIQPVVVRRHSGRYQLIAGERRLRAAIKAGWQHVPAQVREVDDRQMAEIAIVENLQRKDLNPLEKAASFQEYLEQYGCTQEELAGRLKIDRSTIANLIRLLELPESIQQSIRSGTLSHGHARALLPLGDEREQLAVSKRIQEESLSVRATEELVHEAVHHSDREPLTVVGSERPRGKSRRSGGQTALLEQELRAALGTRVQPEAEGQRPRPNRDPLRKPRRIRALARAISRAAAQQSWLTCRRRLSIHKCTYPLSGRFAPRIAHLRGAIRSRPR